VGDPEHPTWGQRKTGLPKGNYLMTAQIQYVRAFLASRNDDGASAVEYGLLVAAIAAVIAGIVFVLGGNVLDAFTTTNDCIEGQGC